MKSFTYIEPEVVPEALALLRKHGDEAKLIAGGTALVNFMKQGLIEPQFVVGLRRFKHMREISVSTGLKIGALTTLNAIQNSPLIAGHAPLLAEACSHVATVRVRNMATIGGALAYADPSLDTPPALVALDARIKLLSEGGERVVSADGFFKGIFETVTEPHELISEVAIPPQPSGSGSAFLKFLPATHDDYATVCVAVQLSIVDREISDVRIALGAVGTTPVRNASADKSLCGAAPNAQAFDEAARTIVGSLEPLANLRASSDYKRAMAAVFVRRALDLAAKRAMGEGRS
jgi:carbon-monoxide dehydrogenase medium subunit